MWILVALAPDFGYLPFVPESFQNFLYSKKHKGVPSTFLEAVHSLQKLMENTVRFI